jgi:hypothetical protein
MSAGNSSSSRICPVCDAPNSAFSLFCAECGASLNGAADGETSSFAPVSDRSTSQETSVFTPMTEPASSATTRREPASTVTPISSNTAYAPDVWSAPTPHATQASPTIHYEPTSMRGFYLGLLATLLILAVFLLWTWAAILDDSTRDSIQDLFGFIG